MKLIIILCATSIWISGCGTCATKQPRLPLPDTPQVPVVKAEEIKDLPDDVKRRLQLQNKLRKAHIERLRSIIKSTWK